MPNIKFTFDFTADEIRRYESIAKKLPNRFLKFQTNGLRYPVETLNKLGKRIIFFPLEEMAEFVDKVCKDRVDTDETSITKQVLNTSVLDVRTNYHQLNATAIGNAAYCAVYSKRLGVREHALTLLEEIYSIESKKRGI